MKNARDMDTQEKQAEAEEGEAPPGPGLISPRGTPALSTVSSPPPLRGPRESFLPSRPLLFPGHGVGATGLYSPREDYLAIKSNQVITTVQEPVFGPWLDDSGPDLLP